MGCGNFGGCIPVFCFVLVLLLFQFFPKNRALIWSSTLQKKLASEGRYVRGVSSI